MFNCIFNCGLIYIWFLGLQIKYNIIIDANKREINEGIATPAIPKCSKKIKRKLEISPEILYNEHRKKKGEIFLWQK